MAKVKDLTGQKFGDLLVIEQAPHVIEGNQKKVAWKCRCVCGKICTVTAQHLTTGNTKSCGCRAKRKSQENKDYKKCVICGKLFYTPPSSKIVTCGKDCSRKYHANLIHSQNLWTTERNKKISDGAKKRDMTELQKIGVEAAKQSPKSGRFVTNINAKNWHLISPDGVHYRFHSLKYWLRHDGAKFFGIEDPDGIEFRRACAGLYTAKRGALGKIQTCTYKDWRVIIDREEED